MTDDFDTSAPRQGLVSGYGNPSAAIAPLQPRVRSGATVSFPNQAKLGELSGTVYILRYNLKPDHVAKVHQAMEGFEDQLRDFLAAVPNAHTAESRFGTLRYHGCFITMIGGDLKNHGRYMSMWSAATLEDLAKYDKLVNAIMGLASGVPAELRDKMEILFKARAEGDREVSEVLVPVQSATRQDVE